MKNWWMLVVLLIGLTGCGFTPVQTGSKTTTVYDDGGNVVSQVQEEKPIADTQTEYQETVRSVTKSETERVRHQTTGIKDICSQNLTHFKGNDAAYALLSVFCADSIAKIKGVDPETIKAIQRSKSGYEVVGELGGKVVDGSVIGMGLHAAGNIVGEIMEGVGDRTNVTNSGDGNSVAISKKETTTLTETHANTTGDNSPPEVNNNQVTNGCPDGNCGEGGEEQAGIDSVESGTFNLQQCLSSPPAGSQGGRAQWTPSCSCESHAAGDC